MNLLLKSTFLNNYCTCTRVTSFILKYFISTIRACRIIEPSPSATIPEPIESRQQGFLPPTGFSLQKLNAVSYCNVHTIVIFMTQQSILLFFSCRRLILTKRNNLCKITLWNHHSGIPEIQLHKFVRRLDSLSEKQISCMYSQGFCSFCNQFHDLEISTVIHDQ